MSTRVALIGEVAEAEAEKRINECIARIEDDGGTIDTVTVQLHCEPGAGCWHLATITYWLAAPEPAS